MISAAKTVHELEKALAFGQPIYPIDFKRQLSEVIRMAPNDFNACAVGEEWLPILRDGVKKLSKAMAKKRQ